MELLWEGSEAHKAPEPKDWFIGNYMGIEEIMETTIMGLYRI